MPSDHSRSGSDGRTVAAIDSAQGDSPASTAAVEQRSTSADSARPVSEAPEFTQEVLGVPDDGDRADAKRKLRRQQVLAAAGGLALAIVLWGGYSHRWSWTGINGGSATLWDWLNLLLLPLVFSVLPVWFNRETRMHPRTKGYAFGLLAAFVLLVILGYAVPWDWTGFRGNTLWDWFGLIVLPVTLILMPRLLEMRREDWRAHHWALSSTLAAIFIAVVLGGYLGKWAWTGFTDNKLWDWMHLLLLPLLLPTLILPMLKPKAMGRVMKVDKDGKPILDEEGNPVFVA
jgi:MFS family permease